MSAATPAAGVFFDLSDRTKLRLTGTDRVRYLNGQVSNDVRKARDGETIHACVLTTKARINADVFIRGDGDSLFIDSDPEVRASLNTRLERYIIADDAEIADVTEEFALLHVLGAEIPSLAIEHAAVRAERFGCPGFDLWLAGSLREAALRELSVRLSFCDADRAEVLRIEKGIPRWGHELSEEIMPPEANLEAAAIDYGKGCYIGQEVISRIKMSGQTNKRLCGFICAEGPPLVAGARLSAGDERKDVGWVTSVAQSERLGRQIALGYVKRGSQAIGTLLEASGLEGSSSSVRVVDLPFA